MIYEKINENKKRLGLLDNFEIIDNNDFSRKSIDFNSSSCFVGLSRCLQPTRARPFKKVNYQVMQCGKELCFKEASNGFQPEKKCKLGT
jgi:hypothetical protein